MRPAPGQSWEGPGGHACCQARTLSWAFSANPRGGAGGGALHGGWWDVQWPQAKRGGASTHMGPFPQGSQSSPHHTVRRGPPVRLVVCQEPLHHMESLLGLSSIFVTFESLLSLAIFLFHFKTFPTFQAFMRFIFSCISSSLVFTSKIISLESFLNSVTLFLNFHNSNFLFHALHHLKSFTSFTKCYPEPVVGLSLTCFLPHTLPGEGIGPLSFLLWKRQWRRP